MISEKICQIQKIHFQQDLLTQKECAVTQPVLTNLNKIPIIYKWYCAIAKNMDDDLIAENIIQRKMFLFIILFLYSPSALNGKKMVGGLREKLAETLALSSHTTISDNCHNLIDFYNTKKNKNNIEKIYQQLVAQIKVKGWIANSSSENNDKKEQFPPHRSSDSKRKKDIALKYNKKNKLEAIVRVQEEFLKHINSGNTTAYIYRTHILPKFLISRCTFYRYLATPAKRDLIKIEKENNPQFKPDNEINNVV